MKSGGSFRVSSGSFRNYGRVDVDTEALNSKKSRRRCIIIIASAIILVVGIVCLSIGVASHSRDSSSSDNSSSSSIQGSQQQTSKESQAIQVVCKATLYPQVCFKDLEAYPGALKAKPTELVAMAVRIAMDHVTEAYQFASTLYNQTSLPGGDVLTKVALQDCMEVMDDARDRLNESIAHLSVLSSAKDLRRQLNDVKIWVTGALSYQMVCTDGFENLAGPDKELMSKRQQDVMEVIVVAFGLVHTLSKVGDDVSSWKNSLVNAQSHSRRLLQHHSSNSVGNDDDHMLFETDGDGFPRWMSTGDRKLLQAPPPTQPTTSPTNTSSTSSNSSSSSSPPSASPYQAVVALDGSGQFTKIQDAIDRVPKDYQGRYTIYIKAGKYAENVIIHKKLVNLMLIGDGIHLTQITGDRNVASGQFTTFRSATVAISAPNFIAKGITFTNGAGFVGHQAVALRIGGDFAAFDTCSFEGYQDTLYALAQRQFYRSCLISGTVDFIFGNAAAIFQQCTLTVRVPGPTQMNTVTAHGRTVADAPTGYSFQSCHVTGEGNLGSVRSFLGRPWKAYSRTVFMKSTIDGIIDPAGWLAWNASNPFIDTVYYGEYENTGAGANTAQRVTWPGVHSSMAIGEAQTFTVSNFIDGGQWLPQANINYENIIT